MVNVAGMHDEFERIIQTQVKGIDGGLRISSV